MRRYILKHRRAGTSPSAAPGRQPAATEAATAPAAGCQAAAAACLERHLRTAAEHSHELIGLLDPGPDKEKAEDAHAHITAAAGIIGDLFERLSR